MKEIIEMEHQREGLISVVVSVYNMEKFLAQTLFCIANQTYRNLEIILVDDGSTDASGWICDAFAETDSRCKVIHKQNGGQSSAKNVGQDASTGAYLFFPDADDIFNLDMIRILYEAICQDTSYDLAISGMKKTDNRGQDVTPPVENFSMLSLSRDELVRGLFSRPDSRYVYGWNKLYKRTLIQNFRHHDYPRHQDFDFNFKVFLHTRKAIFVDAPLYYWVQWEGSKTHQPKTRDLYYDCRTALLHDNWKHLPQDTQQYEHFLLKALYRDMVLWNEWSRKSGLFIDARDKCKGYTKDTVRKYLFCKHIGIWEKTICLTMLSFPSIAHFIMKVTKNAR